MSESFKAFLTESIILEGGAAIKGVSPVPQDVARQILPSVCALVASQLGLKPSEVVSIGSAGNKPSEELSGDLDIVVQTDDLEKVKEAIKELGYDGQYKAMGGINVYSFAYHHKDKTYQVDLMPVDNIEYAKWMFHADKNDLAKGLKSAHRNELLFALAKHVNLAVNGSERTRYLLNMNKGLFDATQSNMGKSGKTTKHFTTTNKNFITDDPDTIIQTLTGSKIKASKVLSFDDLYQIVVSPEFKFKEKKDEILKATLDGIKKKKLTIPDQLKSIDI
jgi:hypothetical protein